MTPRLFKHNSNQIPQNANVQQLAILCNYQSHNNILAIAYHSPLEFNSHLLIALNDEGNIANLSFSYYAYNETRALDECCFSMSFGKTQKVDMGFNLGKIYYSKTIPLPDEQYVALNRSIFQLYDLCHNHPLSREDIPSSKSLLEDIFRSADAHGGAAAIINFREGIGELFAIFIESLTNNFNIEHNRLSSKITNTPRV